MAAPILAFLMAAAINVAVSWGDVTVIPVCERRCVCGRGFFLEPRAPFFLLFFDFSVKPIV